MSYIRFKKFKVSTASLNACLATASQVKKRLLELNQELDATDVGRAEATIQNNKAKLSEINEAMSRLRVDSSSYEVGAGILNKLFNSREMKASARNQLESLQSSSFEVKDDLDNAEYIRRNHAKVLDQIKWLESYLAPIERRISTLNTKTQKDEEKKGAILAKSKVKEEKLSQELSKVKEKRKVEVSTLRTRLALDDKEKRKQFSRLKRNVSDHDNCPYCGVEFSLSIKMHTDHIYPLSKGGSNAISNLVNVCADCNLKKADLTLREFIKKYRLDRDEIELRLEFLNKSF